MSDSWGQQPPQPQDPYEAYEEQTLRQPFGRQGWSEQRYADPYEQQGYTQQQYDQGQYEEAAPQQYGEAQAEYGRVRPETYPDPYGQRGWPEPAPVPAAEPDGYDTAVETPVPARVRRRTRLIVGGVVGVAALAMVVGLATSGSSGLPTPSALGTGQTGAAGSTGSGGSGNSGGVTGPEAKTCAAYRQALASVSISGNSEAEILALYRTQEPKFAAIAAAAPPGVAKIEMTNVDKDTKAVIVYLVANPNLNVSAPAPPPAFAAVMAPLNTDTQAMHATCHLPTS